MFTWLRNAPIGVKVALAPGLAIVCLVMVSALGEYGFRFIGSELQRLGVDGRARVVKAQGLATQLTELHQRLYQSLAWEAIGQRAERIKELDQSLLQQLEAVNRALTEASTDTSISPQQRQIMGDLLKGFAGYRKTAQDTLDMKSMGVENAASFVVSLDGEYGRNKSLVSKFVETELQEGQAQAAATMSRTRGMEQIMLFAVVAVVIVCGWVSWVFSRALTAPMGEAARLASSMAEGDFTARVTWSSTDATGRMLLALSRVSDSLTTIVSEVRGTAEGIRTASTEIATGNADLSQRTERAAGALQQTSASITELASTIRDSAQHAEQADRLARDAAQIARDGGETVRGVVATMGDIEAQARKISEINGVIDGIAFQTNILALNAAVEAARAGEQGRGFSVVAQEVRTLAQRSSDAAREIRQLIHSSVEQISAGASQAQQAGETMERIVGAIQGVSTVVSEIAHTSEVQAAGVEQVHQSVGELDASTQQNAAMVEQAAAVTESLSAQSQRLVGLLERFRTAAV